MPSSSQRSAAAIVILLIAGRAASGQAYRYEAEVGQRIGIQVAASVAGYSGTGYVTGFDSANGSDAVRWQVDVPNGLYEMWVGYRSQYGEKGYNFQVDNVNGTGMFNQTNTFAADRAGTFNLTAATNTFQISQGWGYYDVDYVEFRPYAPPTLEPVSAQLVDPLANPATRVLMRYLATQYGQKTLSGQQHNGSQNLPFPEQSYLNRSGGLSPAVRGSDFIEYSPSRRAFGSNPRNETEQSIAWAKQTGGVVTMMWHWNAPTGLINQPGKEWWRGFYTDSTTFDLPGALANPAGQDYQLLLRDIDAIGVELEKFQAAGVPVVWRPLHEAQGGWFWWGAHGPGTFKQLWNLTYDRLTNAHGLHNLIWEYTSSAGSGDYLDWYPGDDKVDMVGLDIYTDASSNMSGEWNDVLDEYNGRKMIALSETGTMPDAEVMKQWGIKWSYFSPWTGEFINNVPASQLQATLGDEDVITLDELPVLPWKSNATFLSADFDFNGVVDAADLTVWRASTGLSSRGDADLDGDTDGADFLLWQAQLSNAQSVFAATPTEAAVPEPGATVLVMIALTAVGISRRGLPAFCPRTDQTMFIHCR